MFSTCCQLDLEVKSPSGDGWVLANKFISCYVLPTVWEKMNYLGKVLKISRVQTYDLCTASFGSDDRNNRIYMCYSLNWYSFICQLLVFCLERLRMILISQSRCGQGAFQHFTLKMDSTLSVFGRYYSKKRGREEGGCSIRLKITDSQVLPGANLSRVCHKFIPPPFNIDSTQILSCPLAGNNYFNGRLTIFRLKLKWKCHQKYVLLLQI